MNPQNPYDQTTQSVSRNPLSVMQEGERELFHIKRHPIGLLIIYGVCGLLLLTIAIVIFGILPSALPDQRSSVLTIGTIAFFVTVLFTLVVTYIANKVYWGNAWVLTSDSITQIKQTSLFDRQQSQLSLANLEDVTAEQNGILTHIFGYGVVKCETAGEHSKFMFSYCPEPTKYAQMILQAREEFEQGIGHHPNAHAEGVNVNTRG